MDRILSYCEQNTERFEQELTEFLRIPSVSSEPKRKSEVARCANWLAGHLQKIGLQNVSVEPTQGHPIVFANHAGPKDAPTVLIYGHYDVQPEDPIDLWKTPPFEPTLRNGALFGRGTADDKGQLFVYIKAIEAYLKTQGDLPVNVKMIIEGEEEIGSPNLVTYLADNRQRLACDVVAVSDNTMFARGMPSIIYGLRGMVYMQVEVRAANTDLHSGGFGGVVANPANELCAIIAAMKDRDNRVAIQGFYDDVRELTDQEKQMFERLPQDDDALALELGVSGLWGEIGRSTLERKWSRPTLDVNGLHSGFTGEGIKTVLPGFASAKISMRLVPDQDPEQVAALFEQHVKNVAPPSVRVKVKTLALGKPFLCPIDHPRLLAAARALQRGFRKSPVFIREGGSIPIIAEFDRVLGAPILLIGYSVPNENAHAPNEFFLMENFHAGIACSVYLLDELSR